MLSFFSVQFDPLSLFPILPFSMFRVGNEQRAVEFELLFIGSRKGLNRMRIVRKRARGYRSRIKWLCRLRIGFEEKRIKTLLLVYKKKRQNDFFPIFFPYNSVSKKSRGHVSGFENDNYSYFKIFQFQTSPSCSKDVKYTKKKLLKIWFEKSRESYRVSLKSFFKNYASREMRTER